MKKFIQKSINYFSGIEVNFMDDVGQTLLNWASAFGTQEMVEFLCERGADVNKGELSCFHLRFSSVNLCVMMWYGLFWKAFFFVFIY